MKVARLKVVQMRKELQDRGLDSSGTRPILMKRLREAMQTTPTPSTPTPSTPTAAAAPTKSPSPPQPATPPVRTTSAPSSPQPKARTPTPPVSPSQRPLVTASSPVASPKPHPPPHVSAVGHLATAQTAPQDERLRRRRERFGPAADIDKSDAQKQAGSQPVDACAERRRQKFGPVSAKEDKVDRISDASTLQNEQSLKRRGSKFGTSSIQTDVGVVSGSAATSSSRIVVSPEEIERRLKRQRRFQNVATP